MQPSNSERHGNLFLTPQHRAEMSEDEGDIDGNGGVDDNDDNDEIKEPIGFRQNIINPNYTHKSPEEIHRRRIHDSQNISPRETNRSYTPENKKTSHVIMHTSLKTSLMPQLPTINNKLLIGIIIVIIVGITFAAPKPTMFGWFSSNTDDYADINIDKTELFKRCALKNEANFKNQSDDLFFFLMVSTSLPSVLTIIHNTGDVEAECVATSMKKCFNKVYKLSEPPIELRGTDIKENEHFEFFEEIIPKLEKRKFMLIFNLETLNGTVAENLYSICDLDNPAVPNTMIVFTLNVGDYFDKKKYPPGKKATKFLDKHWEDLGVHIRDPLITRLTSNVVEVNKEDSFSCNFYF